MENLNEQIEKISQKNASELVLLAEKNGYKSIRFFVSPDKKISPESVIEDAKEFFKKLESGAESELVYSSK
jgi:hypothetical protein